MTYMYTGNCVLGKRAKYVYITESTKFSFSHLCTCMWGSDWLRAGCQEVSMRSTRGGSRGMYITFAFAKKVNKAEPTLAFKPRGDVTRNSKQGYQCPPKDICPPKLSIADPELRSEGVGGGARNIIYGPPYLKTIFSDCVSSLGSFWFR